MFFLSRVTCSQLSRQQPPALTIVLILSQHSCPFAFLIMSNPKVVRNWAHCLDYSSRPETDKRCASRGLEYIMLTPASPAYTFETDSAPSLPQTRIRHPASSFWLNNLHGLVCLSSIANVTDVLIPDRWCSCPSPIYKINETLISYGYPPHDTSTGDVAETPSGLLVIRIPVRLGSYTSRYTCTPADNHECGFQF